MKLVVADGSIRQPPSLLDVTMDIETEGMNERRHRAYDDAGSLETMVDGRPWQELGGDATSTRQREGDDGGWQNFKRPSMCCRPAAADNSACQRPSLLDAPQGTGAEGMHEQRRVVSAMASASAGQASVPVLHDTGT